MYRLVNRPWGATFAGLGRVAPILLFATAGCGVENKLGGDTDTVGTNPATEVCNGTDDNGDNRHAEFETAIG